MGVVKMSRWLKIAERAGWRYSIQDNSANSDNGIDLEPNVTIGTNVTASIRSDRNIEHGDGMKFDGGLSRGKADRSVNLSDGPACTILEPSPGAPAETWHVWGRQLLGMYSHHGDNARTMAFGVILNRWHQLYHNTPDKALCAGCGAVLSGSAELKLPNGARVHYHQADCSCLVSYGEKWQGEALHGLAQIGLEPPSNFERISETACDRNGPTKDNRMCMELDK
jgi:hypothetical protein